MSHFLTTVYVLVYELHYLARVEPIVFSKVDEQTLVACFRGAWGFSGALATTASAAAFAFSVAALARWFFYFGSIRIVFQEAIESHTDDFLYNIFLVDILEMAVNVL